MASYDDEGRNLDDIRRSVFEDYELEPFDRESLKEIDRMLRNNEYKEEQTIIEHLEFLEQLYNKLENKQLAEGEIGYTNFTLIKTMKEVQRMIDILTSKMSSFKY